MVLRSLSALPFFDSFLGHCVVSVPSQFVMFQIFFFLHYFTPSFVFVRCLWYCSITPYSSLATSHYVLFYLYPMEKNSFEKFDHPHSSPREKEKEENQLSVYTGEGN